LTKTASAIVQHKDGWHGLTLSVKDKEVSDVKVYTGHTLDELKLLFAKQPLGVALDNASGYLFDLNFPFRGRRKISLVIGGELEEMLPFPVEEMMIDFQEVGEEGKVLTAAVPRSTLADFNGRQRTRNVTFQSLAVLHALRWFKRIYQQDLVFINCSGNTAVIMAFKGGEVVHLRQFFRSPQSTTLPDALREITTEGDFGGASYIMVCDSDAAAEKETIERAVGGVVEVPTLDDYVNGESLPAWAWAGIGSALIALDPKGEINLSGEHYRALSGSTRAALYVTASMAGLSLIILGLASLDFYSKQSAYEYLSAEPNRIYRTAFPKAPPVKDVARTFEDRIKKLDRDQGLSLEPAANPLALLNEISTRIGSQVDVKLSEFLADEKEFALAGTTTSFASLDKIKAALGQIKGTSPIELQSVDLAAGGQVRFRLRGKL
jgi:hypothetical protein